MAQPENPDAYPAEHPLPMIDKSRVKFLFSCCGHLETDTVAHAIWTSMLKKQLLSDKDILLPIFTDLPCPRCACVGPSNVADIVQAWTVDIYNSGNWRSQEGDDINPRPRSLIEIGWILSIIADQRTGIKLEVYSTMIRQLAFVCVHIVERKQGLSSFFRIADSTLGQRDSWRFHRAVAQEGEKKRKGDTNAKLHRHYEELMQSVVGSLHEAVDLLQQYLRGHNETGCIGTRKEVKSMTSHLGTILLYFRDITTRAQELKAEVEVQHPDARAADTLTIRMFLGATTLERTRLSGETHAFAAFYEQLEEEVSQSARRGAAHCAMVITKLTVLQCRAESLHEQTCKLKNAIKALDKAENESRVGIFDDCARARALDILNGNSRKDREANEDEKEDGDQHSKAISSSSSVYSRD